MPHGYRQLKNTIKQYRETYMSDYLASHRPMDWTKFWALAYRQALRIDQGFEASMPTDSQRASPVDEKPALIPEPDEQDIIIKQTTPLQTPSSDLIYIDIELDNGNVATIGIGRQDNPQAVAKTFVHQHKLPSHYVKLLASYLEQTLAEIHRGEPLISKAAPLEISFESVSLNFVGKPSLISIRQRNILVVQLHNHQHFEREQDENTQQDMETLIFQDMSPSKISLSGVRERMAFALLTSQRSLRIPSGRKPLVNMELWQIERRYMIALNTSISDVSSLLKTLRTHGTSIASAAFVTNNDEYDGEGSAHLQNTAGEDIGSLSFYIHRAISPANTLR